MKITIDCIENNTAIVICDDGRQFDMPLALLEGGKEGDIFDIIPNIDETEKRKERIEKLAKEMWE